MPSTTATATILTLADLIDDLGGISPSRILLAPATGTATEKHVEELLQAKAALCELVDRTLVEKAVGFRESVLAVVILSLLQDFVRQRNLGLVSGEAGLLRLAPGLVRGPDVAFISWAQIPGGRMPIAPIPAITPDLAVEVLSESNTPREMERKRRDYFTAGTRLVWQIDPESRTAEVFTAPEQSTLLTADQTLDGGEVLPGFTLSLTQLFAELDRQAGP
jgi:Uma2 family endonuclease